MEVEEMKVEVRKMQNPRSNRPVSAGFSVIKDLSKHLCAQLPEEDQKRLAKRAIKSSATPEAWSTSQSTLRLSEDEEASLALRIEQQLKNLGREEDITKFHHLHRQLRHRGKSSIINNRQGLLTFLVKLSERRPKEDTSPPAPNAGNLGVLSQEDVKNKIFRNAPTTVYKNVTQPGIPTNVHRSASAEFPSQSYSQRPTSLRTGNLKNSTVPEEKSLSFGKPKNRPVSSESLSLISSASVRNNASKKGIVPESRVVKELLYCFQGIPGSIFKLDHQQGFSLDPLVKIPHEGLAVKLIELGFLHNRIVHQGKQLEKGGAVAQAIHSAIKKLMTDYYAIIGCMDAELQYLSSLGSSCDTPLSDDTIQQDAPFGIFRLSVVCREPLRTLKLLVDVVKFSLSGKGGAAFSAIETLRHHGDSRYSKIMNQIVHQAGQPLVHMIIVWMVHGTLFDPYDEFFIAINTGCHDRDIWRDKFILRTNLIPSVLSSTHAEMILRAGKGINFLNSIRDVKLPLEGLRKKLHQMKGCNIIDFADPRSHLCEMLSGVVEETSKLVLDVLINEFKLFQHFQGLRRYILLGQGDFASYFLELIEPEMRKEASRLQYHELTSMLGTAIRGSTAAHDNPEIIRRVTVKVLEASGGDWGYDVFGLQYLMHEPLDAAFRISGGAYSHMFNFLWRTKRMEHVLLLLRKERWTTNNELTWVGERVPEVNSVLMLADMMAQEFLHFAREFHYYILFEVVECSWEKFCQDFSKARSFDDVIHAHEEFLAEMQRRTLQRNENPRERTFFMELRCIWDLAFEVEVLQHTFFARLLKEYDYRKEREARLDSGSGSSYQDEEIFKTRKKEFKNFLASMKAQYNIIHRNYQDILKKFLLDLSSQKDHDLRLLSLRIDYNEYYKRADSRLNESMKFSRCSDMFY